jgi:acetyl esterase/lipase
MKKSNLIVVVLYGLAGCLSCTSDSNKVDEIASLYSNTQVIGDIVYRSTSSRLLKLDAYIPVKRLGEPPWIEYSEPLKPTLLFFHGGGWTSGNKISRSLFLMPYIEHGFSVVTADYRLLDEATLPEIIEDTRAALHWIYTHQAKYRFDTARILVSGESAGGHLALMNGVLNGSNLFLPDSLKTYSLWVAGVINWFGVADLNEAYKDWDMDFRTLVGGTDSTWAQELLKQCSPVTYIDSNTVPVLTIHGSEDKAADYKQALLLHRLLDQNKVKNKLWTIPGKKHGNFDPKEMTAAVQQIWNFIETESIFKPSHH